MADRRLDRRGQRPPVGDPFRVDGARNFIKNTYMATKDGKLTLTGGQIIGWNPKLGRIVSWHFDAEGGFGDDAWTKDGSKWVIEATGVFRNGSESTCRQRGDAHRRQQLHVAVAETHAGRRKRFPMWRPSRW